MRFLIVDRVSHLFNTIIPQANSSISHAQPSRTSTVSRVRSPSPTKRRLAITNNELETIRSQLLEEQARRIRWERRAMVASADLVQTRSLGDPVRLKRLLTLAEEQRDIALSRLATNHADVDGVHEQNRTLQGTISRMEMELAATRADLQLARRAWHDAVLTVKNNIYDEGIREARLGEQISVLLQQLHHVSTDRETLRDRINFLENELVDARIDSCTLDMERVQRISLEDRFHELQTSQVNTMRRYTILENDHAQIQAEKNELQLESIPKLESVNEQLNNKLQCSVEKQKQLENQLSEMRDKFSTVSNEIEQLRLKNTQLHEGTSKSYGLIKRIEELEKALAESDAKNQASEEYIIKFKSQVTQERETLAEQLSARAKGFARVEAELTEARQTYIKAARRFERERKVSRRMSTSAVEGNEKPLVLLQHRISELERENEELKRIDYIERRRLSSSSVSSEEDMMRKVAELEMSLEMESQAKKEAEMKVNELMKQANEVEDMRNEMSNIHSKMRRMATVSLPRDAEQLLLDGEDEDARRLREIREQTRREEAAEKEEATRKENKTAKESVSVNKLERSIEAHVKRFSQKRKIQLPVLDTNNPRFRSYW